MTALAATIATVVIELEKRLGMIISSREKQEGNQGGRQCCSFQMDYSKRRCVEGAIWRPQDNVVDVQLAPAVGINVADN
jgi:hypothetical protein